MPGHKRRYKRRKGSRRVPRDADELKQVWFEYNGYGFRRWREDRPELLQIALDFKYVHWPFKVKDFATIKGAEIIDLGCGRSLHGVAFALLGAKRYTGVDPIIELDVDRFKDTRVPCTGNKRQIGWTPRKIAQRIRRIHYLETMIEDLGADRQWDLFIMHNVTEHLMNIETAFAHIPRHLRKDGLLVFRHPNHFAWNGHHMKPRFIDEIDPEDAEQKRYMDWAHVVFDPTWPDLITKRQNRIRLHDLRALTEQHFEIVHWNPEMTSEREGRDRLTDEILARHPDFSREELLTQCVVCVCRHKCA